MLVVIAGAAMVLHDLYGASKTAMPGEAVWNLTDWRGQRGIDGLRYVPLRLSHQLW